VHIVLNDAIKKKINITSKIESVNYFATDYFTNKSIIVGVKREFIKELF
jgi:hypothetical protein